MEELEYITDNALIMCDQGGSPAFFKSTFNKKVKIHGCLVATAQDAVPIVNIPSFKVCKINGGACLPATAPAGASLQLVPIIPRACSSIINLR